MPEKTSAAALRAGGRRWDKAQIVIQSLKGVQRKTLIEGGSDARFVPTGHIVYALAGSLFAVPFDLAREEVTGGPTPVLEGVGRAPNGNTAYTQHQTTAQGSVGTVQTSAGGKAVATSGAYGNNAAAGQTANGNKYAAANGNVYKRDNGQWYQNQNGSWNTVDKNDLNTQRQEGAARDLGNRNSQRSEQWRSNGGAAARGQGLEQRPQFQGRRK